MGEELKFCSNCKKSVSTSNFTIHNVHCQKNIINCSLCREPVIKAQYQQHVENDHSANPCQQCGALVEAVNLCKHNKDLCTKRLLTCQYCEMDVLACDAEKHLEFCGARTDRCKGCTKYVQFKHLQFHYENDHKYLNPQEKEKIDANGEDGDIDEECPVCLGPITLPLSLQCGHVFCMVCVKGIANTTKNCAICRRDIQRDMLMDIRFCREEDIIKNYVNNPKYKKTTRSKNVPRGPVAVTTRDYDNMVSALMSSRTSTSNCRYQRPSNSHTPPLYTPYCYATSSYSNSSTSSHPSQNSEVKTTSNTYYDDDCCCISSSSTSNNSKVNDVPSTSDSKKSDVAKPSLSVASSTTSTSNQYSISSTSAFQNPNSVSSVSPVLSNQNYFKDNKKSLESSTENSSKDNVLSSSSGRPNRPTSLALQPDNTVQTPPPIESNNQHLSQEEYDRWLAFQLAKAEDEISASEFNKTHRSPFRRSRSMPERKEVSEKKEFENQESSSQNKNDYQTLLDAQSRLPPTPPRCSSVTPAPSHAPPSSHTSRGSSLSKSSSDSITTTNNNSSNANSLISTGARPKSSTGLKKRVSFKEDTPPIRRQAPVMLPCEFCEEMFPERDLMRHQTSCDDNETKNPREYLLARRSSVTSPATTPNSPLSPTPLSSLNAYAISSKPPSSPLNRSTESPARTSIRNLRTPPHSPSQRPRLPQSPTSPPLSPLLSSTSPQLSSGLSEEYDSAFHSRNNSVSPGLTSSSSSTSTCGGGSSGVSSISSSSASTTPSTSSSASPVSATTQSGTSTDIEADIEEDEIPFPRPRKGRLLSSAIISWRSISGERDISERPKYGRSQTAPIQINTHIDDDQMPTTGNYNRSATSIKLSQVQHVPEEKSVNVIDSSESSKTTIFKRNKNKYPAPLPPKMNPITKCAVVAPIYSPPKEERSSADKIHIFKFDSVPAMTNQQTLSISNDVIPCEFCKEVFLPEKFRDHQTMCDADSENNQSSNHSKPEEQRNDITVNQPNNIPKQRSKGQAPEPPTEVAVSKRKSIERASSVREDSGAEYRRSREFQSSGRRLERACSIKETSRFSRSSYENSQSRWSSREGMYSSSLDLSAAYSGGASLTSSTSSLNNYSGGNGWSSHVSMIRDDVRYRRPATTLGSSSSTSHSFFGTSRFLDRGSRYRPSSFYSSSFRSTIYI